MVRLHSRLQSARLCLYPVEFPLFAPRLSSRISLFLDGNQFIGESFRQTDCKSAYSSPAGLFLCPLRNIAYSFGWVGQDIMNALGYTRNSFFHRLARRLTMPYGLEVDCMTPF